MSAKRTRHAPLSAEAVKLVAARFRILGDPIRVQILQALQAGERNVSELVADVGSTQPNISKHLRILQDARFVTRRQNGNNVYYAIADPTVFELCDLVCGSVSTQLTQHAPLVDELRRRARRRR
ncbi:MAG TPA: metalloregulator ArsR/SmtB family transcription factor [Thermoanaerobaculia bacterium]